VCTLCLVASAAVPQRIRAKSSGTFQIAISPELEERSALLLCLRCVVFDDWCTIIQLTKAIATIPFFALVARESKQAKAKG
jgi:hypothetical protein